MTYFIFFCVTLLVSAVLTPLVKIIAVKTGYVVQPRQDRWHKKPTPLLGGIAIFLSFSVSYLLAFGFDRKTMPVLIGGFLIFLLGLVDDLKRLNPQVKLIGQITVAAVLISLDVVVKIIPYPVIAMLNGHAFGAGFDLAMTCDLRIAAENAQVGIPPAKLGIVYQHDGIQRLINIAGLANAKEVFLLPGAATAPPGPRRWAWSIMSFPRPSSLPLPTRWPKGSLQSMRRPLTEEEL